jgi:hypothetical protein
MANSAILSDAEVAIRNERRRQDEQWGGAAADDTRAQEDWRCAIRKQVNEMVKLDEALMNEILLNGPKASTEPVEEFRVRWVKVGALAVAALESLDRLKRAKIGGVHDGGA